MKKIALLLLLALSLSALISCGEEPEPVHTHSYSEATCLTPPTCSCGRKNGSVTNVHSFENAVCTVCSKPLIAEIGSYAIDENHNVKDGFKVETVSGYINGKPKALTMYWDTDIASPENRDYYRTSMTLTQDTFLKDEITWSIVRRIYNAERNVFAEATLTGTVKASDLSSITVTKNEGNSLCPDGFTESEISEYSSHALAALNTMVDSRLIPLIAGNESGITVVDLGFIEWAENRS